MAASFKKTAIKTIPRVGEIVTTDTLFWKNLEVRVIIWHYSHVFKYFAISFIIILSVKTYCTFIVCRRLVSVSGTTSTSTSTWVICSRNIHFADTVKSVCVNQPTHLQLKLNKQTVLYRLKIRFPHYSHRGSQLYFHITRYVLKRKREDTFWGGQKCK